LRKATTFDPFITTHSTGSAVRDAAFYALWSFARCFSPAELAPWAERLACACVGASVSDREVGIRRSGSAAFQEGVGRLVRIPSSLPPDPFATLRANAELALGRSRASTQKGSTSSPRPTSTPSGSDAQPSSSSPLKWPSTSSTEPTCSSATRPRRSGTGIGRCGRWLPRRSGRLPSSISNRSVQSWGRDWCVSASHVGLPGRPQERRQSLTPFPLPLHLAVLFCRQRKDAERTLDGTWTHGLVLALGHLAEAWAQSGSPLADDERRKVRSRPTTDPPLLGV
jgi:hypothetical protein